jgi:hypothetical protein
VETAELAARRIAEHARAHALNGITLILHGGEPLLAGRDLIERLVERTRSGAGPGITVDARVQTNAVGLSDAYLRLFDDLGVQVGVSIDGDVTADGSRRIGAYALSAQCRACSIQRVCGGGLYSHRYREGTGFANPSAYRAGLMALISHIRDGLQAAAGPDYRLGVARAELLVHVQLANPVAAQAIIGYPSVGAWALDTLRALREDLALPAAQPTSEPRLTRRSKFCDQWDHGAAVARCRRDSRYHGSGPHQADLTSSR